MHFLISYVPFNWKILVWFQHKFILIVQVGRWPIVNETSLIQVMVLSPVRVWPGLQLTSTTVPTITGKVLVVIMSDTAAGSSVHVSERERGTALKFVVFENFILKSNVSKGGKTSSKIALLWSPRYISNKRCIAEYSNVITKLRSWKGFYE